MRSTAATAHARISTSSSEPGSISSPASIRRDETRIVEEDPVEPEHVRHEVVREDRERLDVVEPAEALAAEREPEVGARELRALVERDGPAPVVATSR